MGYRFNGKLSPDFVLAADLNPGNGPNSNSRTHEQVGQNVLYADGHSEWKTTPKVGVNGDDIYVNRNGQVPASPVDANDDVLLPTAN